MQDNNRTEISAYKIKKGDFIRFRLKPLFAKNNGFTKHFKKDTDGIDQGFVTAVSEKAVRLSYCEIHEIREVWIPKSVFVYAFVRHKKTVRDWVKKSENYLKISSHEGIENEF